MKDQTITTPTMESITEACRKAWTEKGHMAEYYVPGIRFLGLTIRKSYMGHVWFKCECGQSTRDKMIASLYAPNPLLNMLLKNTIEKENA